MRINEWLLLRRCKDLHAWLKRHYSEKELEELAAGKSLGNWFVPHWNPWDSPYSIDQYMALSGRHLELAHKVYSRYRQEIWGCCFVKAHEVAFGYSMEQCAIKRGCSVEAGENIIETHGMNPIRMLSHLELAGRVNDADSFVQFMVFNAFSVAAAGLVSAASPRRTISRKA